MQALASEPCQPLATLYGSAAIVQWVGAQRAAAGSAGRFVRAEHGAGCLCFASKAALLAHLRTDHALPAKRTSARDEAVREGLGRYAMRGADALVQRW